MRGTGEDDVPWLDEQERRTWLSLVALTTVLPSSVDGQLQREAGLSFFEYTVLAMLSEAPNQTMRMSGLAVVVNGSLSRLSHVAKRLEGRGYLERSPLPDDGRITVATLTSAGFDEVRRTAPSHVLHVRRLVLDQLSSEELRVLATACLKIVNVIDPVAVAGISAEVQPQSRVSAKNSSTDPMASLT